MNVEPLERRDLLAGDFPPADIIPPVADEIHQIELMAAVRGSSPSRLGRLAECYGYLLADRNDKIPELGIGGCCGAYIETLVVDLAICDAWRDPEFEFRALCIFPENNLGGVWCHNVIQVVYTPPLSIGRTPFVFYIDNGFLGNYRYPWESPDKHPNIFVEGDRGYEEWFHDHFVNFEQNELNQQIRRLARTKD